MARKSNLLISALALCCLVYAQNAPGTFKYSPDGISYTPYGPPISSNGGGSGSFSGGSGAFRGGNGNSGSSSGNGSGSSNDDNDDDDDDNNNNNNNDNDNSGGSNDFGGFGGGGGNGNSGNNGNGDTGNNEGNRGPFGDGNGGFASQFGNFQTAYVTRIAHGVVAGVAFVIFFPIGAMMMRLVPGRFAIWFHAVTQMFAYVLYIIGAALGFWMVRNINLPFLNLLNEPHVIIGIVVFAFLFMQPIFGFWHHSTFKRTGQRSLWSYLHLWLGRGLITLGMINGGLGLLLANNTRAGNIAYGVVAGIMWVLWMLVSVSSEILRFKSSSRQPSPDKVEEGRGREREEVAAGALGSARGRPTHASPDSSPEPPQGGRIKEHFS